LAIKSPLGKWSEKILQKRNYRFINRFTACWVPDVENKNGLAGELSHPAKKPVVPVHYIGSLSRFESSSLPVGGNRSMKDHLLIILSGPEPQRSMLEDKIIKEISHYHSTATIVRGLPGESSIIPSSNMILFYNHLPAVELNKEMLKAEFVISRSGYSTAMDLMAVQKKSILIPTPGQTEQEYLAQYLSQKQFAFCISQKEFSLTAALEKARQFEYHFPDADGGHLLRQVIANFIATLTGPQNSVSK
jgi:UDP-N-acetylglucosamine transferase subunit ALG13